MGSRMTVTATRTYSVPDVCRIMTQPSLWATAAEDGQDPDKFKPDLNGDCWLRLEADGEAIGLYQLQMRNSVLVEIHANIMPKYRKEHSEETGHAVLRWIVEEVPDCRKIIAWVPKLYPNVRDFTLQFGFRVEGVNRLSYRKNGKLHDQWLLGITKDEIGET